MCLTFVSMIKYSLVGRANRRKLDLTFMSLICFIISAKKWLHARSVSTSTDDSPLILAGLQLLMSTSSFTDRFFLFKSFMHILIFDVLLM